MDSGILKTEALCWLRFVKKMDLVATEAGAWSADVLGMSETTSIELEVKITKSDLRREFDQKRTKHFLYNGVEEGKAPSRQTPNYFYFYVPFWLQEEALKLIQLHSPKAGLAVYGEGKGHYLDGRRTVIVKKPTKLHGKPPTASFRRTLLLRMGSELCARYVAEREMAECVSAFMRDTNAKVLEKVHGLASPFPFLGDEEDVRATGQEDESGPGPNPIPGLGDGGSMPAADE